MFQKKFDVPNVKFKKNTIPFSTLANPKIKTKAILDFKETEKFYLSHQ